ncbi:SAM-dependent methyltransferase [Paenibacillus sp. V4I3]|uniref:class I SAM-dependent methyltransferase n=1 Tax=unclassified Paenibacillus TaxID=185978 RepID=UPI0027824DED|nr:MULTISPECIES: class I SAM-dependent methyltransferase [unclassified Paenibacillus]MDQ0875538.1 SAM-dependent methyltransferase [Paenibacillus sp. V4I3]MDQ0888381.1 SAM-dependent methyltransferase [Paenibacillus sp. V4I9]
MDPEVKATLKMSYDQHARLRDGDTVQSWKVDEMDRFLARLQAADRGSELRILDLGSGPGHQAIYLKNHGYHVTCVDLSEEMVNICLEKGLEAFAMDFYTLDLEPESFDAIWTMNALLHVPKDSLLQVLVNLERVLKQDGFLYMGLYGGYESEGIWKDDAYRPQRFFAFYEDEHIQRKVTEVFDIEHFSVLPIEGMKVDYQSVLARKKKPNPLLAPK